MQVCDVRLILDLQRCRERRSGQAAYAQAPGHRWQVQDKVMIHLSPATPLRPEQVIEKRRVGAAETLALDLAPGGGAAIRFVKR